MRKIVETLSANPNTSLKVDKLRIEERLISNDGELVVLASMVDEKLND